jgi:hypothetical protein
MVRGRFFSAVSNHEAEVLQRAAILRDENGGCEDAAAIFSSG